MHTLQAGVARGRNLRGESIRYHVIVEPFGSRPSAYVGAECMGCDEGYR